MHLDVSRNIVTDEAVKTFAKRKNTVVVIMTFTEGVIHIFAELITKFEGLRSVNLMSIRPKMNKKDTGYIDLAKALKENKSIVELDLRDNEIIDTSAQKILEALEYNFVLSDVRFDVKQKRLPQNFSSYALQSMYEFTMSIEEIALNKSPLVTTEADLL